MGRKDPADPSRLFERGPDRPRPAYGLDDVAGAVSGCPLERVRSFFLQDFEIAVFGPGSEEAPSEKRKHRDLHDQPEDDTPEETHFDSEPCTKNPGEDRTGYAPVHEMRENARSHQRRFRKLAYHCFVMATEMGAGIGVIPVVMPITITIVIANVAASPQRNPARLSMISCDMSKS